MSVAADAGAAEAGAAEAGAAEAAPGVAAAGAFVAPVEQAAITSAREALSARARRFGRIVVRSERIGTEKSFRGRWWSALKVESFGGRRARRAWAQDMPSPARRQRPAPHWPPRALTRATSVSPGNR